MFREAPHLLCTLLRALPHGRRDQALDRSNEIIQAVAHISNQRHLGGYHIAHAGAVDAHIDELDVAADQRRGAGVLQLVAHTQHHISVFWIGQRTQPAAGRRAHPQRMSLRKIGIHLARLRDGHAQQFRQLHRFCYGLGVVNLITHVEQRHLRIEQQPGGTFNLHRIGPHAHARVNLVMRNDFGLHPLVVEIRMPRRIGRAIGRRPRGLKGAAYGFRDHVGAACQPTVFGQRRNQLFLIGYLFKTIAPGAPRLIGAITIKHQRRLLFKRIEHLPHGVHQTHHRGLHHDGRLARCFHIARSHRRARPLVRREYVFELGPVHQRFVELRILARGIAEYVFHAGGHQLLGHTGAARALKSFYAAERPGHTCLLRMCNRYQRLQHGFRRRRGDTSGGESLQKITPRYRVRQKTCNQFSHGRASCARPYTCAR